MNDRSSPYQSYRHSMSTAIDPGAITRWRLFLIKGDSDYLLGATRRILKEVYEKAGWKLERSEGSSFTAERFYQAISARSLFDPKTITLLNDAQSTQDLLSCLQAIKDPKDIQNPMFILWRGKDPSPKLLKEIERLGTLRIPCDEPAPWEFKDFLGDLNRRYKLSLSTDAIDLVLEAVGNDLFKLDNEMRRLALSLGESSGPRNAAALRPHLGFLREDHVFKIDQWLCVGATSKALLLMKDLTDRGEKPLALLAILAMHCRKALQVQSGLKAGANAQDLARQMRLAPRLVQTYIPYVQKRSMEQFQRALQLCHEADRRLKSRREGEELWLSQILFELRAPLAGI